MALALALLLSSPTPASAVAAAVAVPGARAELVSFRPAALRGCVPGAYEATRPVTTSGAVPVRFTGRDGRGEACEGYGWARVRVFAPALVATRALRSGEPLEGAVAPGEAELAAGRTPLAALPPGATAARPVQAGAALDAAAIRSGPRPGDAVGVVIRSGSLTLAQTGRAVPCARGRACAVLPSGKRVEGVLDGDRIVVEAP